MRWLIIILFLSVGCSPKWHLRQAEKHLQKAQQLGAVVKADTIYVSREIIVPEVKTDTVLKTLNFRDTLFLERDKIKIKLRIDTVKKSVYIAVDCPSDTLRIKVPVTVTKEINSEFPWGWLVLCFCAGAVLGLFASRNR